MISLDRLACRAYEAQALKETFGEDSPLATRMPATPATEVQHKDHRNTLDEGLAEDAGAGYGASANVPHVPHVHQSCVRT